MMDSIKFLTISRIGDIITTAIGVSLSGASLEMNPISRFVLEAGGVPLFVLEQVVALWAMIWLFRKNRQIVAPAVIAVSILSWIAIVINSYTILATI